MINVLIVEDDPMVIKFNKYYLEQIEGFMLKGIARSSDQALDVLKKEKIDLILLDIYMPVISGLELLVQVRTMDTNIDVIIVSAAKDSASVKKALQYGAVDYLIKPFEFERFSSALNNYKNRENIIKSNDLSQEELDRHILYVEQNSFLIELPKGLEKNTLKLSWEKIIQNREINYSTEELAKLVGISRVSMRKYVNFLEEAGAINKKVIYGSIGRPIYRYECLKTDKNLINSIIKY
ncbi:MAG: response regulator [Clostridium sp.]|uniref:response regulator n=1 Tax=Clostridium sp. TaxID=1506 RepID=UPI003D6D559E